jgi:hypothetical protein
MADFSQTRRILRLHPAHGTVGVASLFRPCRDVEPTSLPIRVLLVSGLDNHHNDAAITAFERIVLNERNAECERVDLADVERHGLADADCAVVFGHGLQIVGQWSAFEAHLERFPLPLPMENAASLKIEAADAARWHPVLDGVGPFVSHRHVPAELRPPRNSTCLLVRRMTDRVVPVAWAQHGENRSVFTVLGHAEDFRQPAFARLLLNALEWVRG